MHYVYEALHLLGACGDDPAGNSPTGDGPAAHGEGKGTKTVALSAKPTAPTAQGRSVAGSPATA